MRCHHVNRLLAATALAGTVVAAFPGVAQELLVIDPEPGGTYSEARGISGDGTVAVGKFEGAAASWTSPAGFVPLGSIGGSSSEAHGASLDGSVITGTAYNGASEKRAFRWTEAGGMVDLGNFKNGGWVEGWAISDDGSVIAGFARDGEIGKMRAIRWTEAGGIESLGVLREDGTSFGYGVSGDGSTIVGSSHNPTSGIWQEAFRWTEAGGMSELGKINNGDFSVARATSYDGSVIVGEATDGADGNTQRAFRWTQAGGMESLGLLNGGSESFGYDVSSDGSVVVGTAKNGDRSDVLQAFRWTEADGMQTVEDWLRGNGATIAEEVTNTAYGVSGDGSIVVGKTNLSQMFIARASGGSEPGDGPDAGPGTGPDAGLVTVDDLTGSLAGTGAANGAAVAGLNTILNGAGSRPLDRRAKTGNRVLWAAGDLGQMNHGFRQGDFGLGELGAGYRFGPVQLNAAIGHSRQRLDTVFGGHTEIDSTYLKAEALALLHDGGRGEIWGVFTVAGAFGDASIRRNYLVNGGATDTSLGTTDASGFALRGRLQWDKALPYVSPYGELSWMKSCMNGFTETGGAFPASFAKLCDTATEARIGFDATVPVNERFRLTATMEGVHRFEDTANSVQGTVIGLNTFDFAGADHQQDWLRGGLGFETDLGRSVFSVMANATTKGESPSAWLAASWRASF